MTDNTGSIEGVYGFPILWRHAVDVLGSEEAAQSWFWSPCILFRGDLPIDVAKTEVGSFRVDAILTRIEHGVFS